METLKSDTKHLVILASGTGTLFSSIVQACKNNTLKAKVISLISNNKKSLVLQKAKREKVPVKVLDPKDFTSFKEWDAHLCSYLKTQKPDLILLAGFVKKIGPEVLASFKGRILNIHPSLLPRHGGQGMYGIHVHRSVIESGDHTTGISIHLVSEEYDTGSLLAQKEISVSSEDNPESLQEKVKKIEAVFYVSTLQKILEGKIPLETDR